MISKANRSILLLLILAASFAPLGFVDNYFEVSKNLDVFATLFKELNSYYVDDLEPSELMRKGIDAILESLDPYTNFISEAEMEDYRFQTTGKYGGIGALIGKRNDAVVVSEPYEGYPAHKSDVRAGDKILEIDGNITMGKDTDEVSKALKGQPGTEVKILIQRYGSEKPILKTLTREEIVVKSVPYYGLITEDIGYIRFTSFKEKAGKEVRIAFEDLKKQQDAMKGIILDLRGNGGGLLHEAVNVSNIFIPKGREIVSTKGKVKEWEKTYKTLNGVVDGFMPLIILTDGASASASEIVAGAIQDYDRGVILGDKTFGKGLVQTTRPLSYNNQLKITTAKYYIPSGRCIQSIDYSSSDSNGESTSTPDSLKSVFKTRNNRTVYELGGIDPDILVKPKKLSNISSTLYFQETHIMDFATIYRAEHEQIPKAREYRFSDEDFQDFVKFLEDKDYEYKTKSEAGLDKLEEVLKAEKYYDVIKSDLQSARAKMKQDKANDLVKFKDEIIEILQNDIVTRYYFQRGKIEARFDYDEAILKAVELLQKPAEYKKILAQKE